MHINDSLSTNDGSGLSNKQIWVLQDHGISSWHQAKSALENGVLVGLRGVGRKTIDLVREARPCAI